MVLLMELKSIWLFGLDRWEQEHYRSKKENLYNALNTCARFVADDWASTYKIDGQKITLCAFDVSDLDKCQWDSNTVTILKTKNELIYSKTVI